MPWTEERLMDQKVRMVAAYLEGARICDLSREYGVSRKTVRKWTSRYTAQGAIGLEERSRAPHGRPNQTDASLVELLLAAKRQWPSWGPKKLVAWLERTHPEFAVPAASTAGEWLKKHGHVKRRLRSRKVSEYTAPLCEARTPNDVWTVDYKGEFRTGDGRYCYPLTICDCASRYILCCTGLEGPRYEPTREAFERLFYEYGLPWVIRSDNGTPFAGRSLGGLSRLSVWWLKAGIIPERIRKGHPQENGIHERMHRTLKAQTATPSAGDLRSQELAFCGFVREYNESRPHEGLGMRTPGEVYRRSVREYRGTARGFEYDSRFSVRSVRSHGEVKWRGGLYFLTELLCGERVGISESGGFGAVVHAGGYPLCRLDERHGRACELSREERLQLLPMSPV